MPLDAALLRTTPDILGGARLRVSYPLPLTGQALTLRVLDAGTGAPLLVEDYPAAGGRANWLVRLSADAVLTLLLSDGVSLLTAPLLANYRAAQDLARALKHYEHAGSDADHAQLQDLRLYHALCFLLFSEKDYATCQAHLDLLADLTPGGPC